MADNSNAINAPQQIQPPITGDGSALINLTEANIIHSPVGSMIATGSGGPVTNTQAAINELAARSGFIAKNYPLGHGFTFQGQLLAADQTLGYIAANANADSTSTPIGAVYYIIDANNVIIKTFGGEMQITTGQVYINGTLQNLSSWLGWTLYMSENTPGGLSSTKPIANNSIIVQVAVVTGNNSLSFKFDAVRTAVNASAAKQYSLIQNHKAYCNLNGAKASTGLPNIATISGNTINFNFASAITFSHDDCSEEVCSSSADLNSVTVPSTNNQTYYIIKERGNPVPIATTAQPAIAYGPPTNGVGALNTYWLDISSKPYVGYKYNGSIWVPTPHCGCIMEVSVGSTGVINSMFIYAFDGKYRSNWFAVSVNNDYPISHMVGSNQLEARLRFSAAADGSNWQAVYSCYVLAPNSSQFSQGGSIEQVTASSLILRTGRTIASGTPGVNSSTTSIVTTGFYQVVAERDW